MRKPWKNTLIIKMFDGKLGYMSLMKRLKKVWQVKGELTLTDIGCKFFIARFSNLDDYNFVLTQAGTEPGIYIGSENFPVIGPENFR